MEKWKNNEKLTTLLFLSNAYCIMVDKYILDVLCGTKYF
jgi:hypothetical protein